MSTHKNRFFTKKIKRVNLLEIFADEYIVWTAVNIVESCKKPWSMKIFMLL
jgi:hypothetical protein